MKVSEAAKLWLEYHKCHSKENSIRVHKLETIGVFALMIPEIASQKVKISSTLKTCDKSDI